jgi:diguanylate cyclase (GGDEF)-like protein
MRLLLLAVLMSIQLIPGATPDERAVSLSVIGAALVLASVILWLVMRGFRPWMAVASSALDVSLVSVALGSYLALGHPGVTINSRTSFDVYFLAIFCASLRYNWRISAFTGALAIAEYAGLVLYATSHYDLSGAAFEPRYGEFVWNTQLVRLVLLGATTAISAAVALRAQGLRVLSSTDRLTSLLNRGSFDERLNEEAIRARRHKRPLAIAIADIDHFKLFNDTHGHPAGDRALMAVADLLREALRRSDVVARYGGEEFAVILPEGHAAEALPRMEAIRAAVAARKLAVPSGLASVTISIGLAGWPEDGAAIDEVVAAADRRLYAAKRAGRNRVMGPKDVVGSHA